MALDSSERADLEDLAETQGVASDPEDLAGRTGPVDRGDSPADMALWVFTDSLQDRVICEARVCLIGRSRSVDQDCLPFVGVAEPQTVRLM